MCHGFDTKFMRRVTYYHLSWEGGHHVSHKSVDGVGMFAQREREGTCYCYLFRWLSCRPFLVFPDIQLLSSVSVHSNFKSPKSLDPKCSFLVTKIQLLHKLASESPHNGQWEITDWHFIGHLTLDIIIGVGSVCLLVFGKVLRKYFVGISLKVQRGFPYGTISQKKLLLLTLEWTKSSILTPG